MANSYISYTGDGATTAFSVPFPFIVKGHLVVKVNGVTKTQDTDFTVSGSTVTFGSAPANAASIHISRNTPKDEMLVNFVDGAVITADDLDTAQTQTFYGLQEVQESSIQSDPENYDAVDRRIVNVADPEDAQDAATQAYVDAADAVLDAAKEDVGVAASAVSAHAALTETHGATGAVVGTTNTQTLTNKTISGASNTLSNIPQSAVTGLETAIATGVSHAANTSNPHSVTATQVGLGNVQNYGIASQAEAEAGTATNKYMTPERVAQAIDALAPPAGGDVVGPASSTANAIALFDGTTGELLKNSGATWDDGLLSTADIDCDTIVVGSMFSATGGDISINGSTTLSGAITGTPIVSLTSVTVDGTNDKVLIMDASDSNKLKMGTLPAGGGSGDVVGPASATDNAVARFDSTTGKLVQNSAVTIADTSGNMAGVGTINTHTIPGGTDTFALLAATQTLTNKTLTSPVINVGSDATGDIYYRNGSGAFTRLAAGTNGHVLKLASGIPSWAAESGGGGGVLVKKLIVQDSTASTGTTQIPFDDTIPQNTEGTEYGTQSYTPSASGNTLLVRVSGFCSASTDSGNCTVAIFKDSVADAYAVEDYTSPGANGRMKFSVVAVYTTVGTSAETWKMRFGPGSGITAAINRTPGGEVFGNRSFVTWEFYEYTP